ncbi:MAG: hypothetical protein ACO1RX_10855 [Candidatus Sericytochromatia bacterium]
MILAVLLGLGACARRVYVHGETPLTSAQGVLLGRVEIEGWETLSYLDPVRQPQGAPYLFLEFDTPAQSGMAPATGPGYFAFPAAAGRLRLTRLVLLSPYASRIELTPTQPLEWEVKAQTRQHVGTLQLVLTPESRRQNALLPRTYGEAPTQAKLLFQVTQSLGALPEGLQAGRQTWHNWPLENLTYLQRIKDNE